MKCPKCWSEKINTMFHAAGSCADNGTLHNTAKEEHLHRYCEKCEYDWVTPCMDAKENNPQRLSEMMKLKKHQGD